MGPLPVSGLERRTRGQWCCGWFGVVRMAMKPPVGRPKPVEWSGWVDVVDIRGLGKKADQNDIWCWVVKVAGYGNTLEVQTKDRALVDRLGVGMFVFMRGVFELRNNGVQLSLLAWDEADSKAA